MIQWTSIVITGLVWALSVHYRIHPVYCTVWFIGSTAITYYYARKHQEPDRETQIEPSEDLSPRAEPEA